MRALTALRLAPRRANVWACLERGGFCLPRQGALTMSFNPRLSGRGRCKRPRKSDGPRLRCCQAVP